MKTLPSLSELVSRRPMGPAREALPQQDQQLRLCRIHAVSGGDQDNCEVEIAEVRMIDSTYTQTLGIQDITSTIRRGTAFYAAVPNGVTPVVDEVWTAAEVNNRLWLLQKYGACDPSASPCPSVSPEPDAECPCETTECYIVEDISGDVTNLTCADCVDWATNGSRVLQHVDRDGFHDQIYDLYDSEAVTCVWISAPYSVSCTPDVMFWIMRMHEDGTTFLSVYGDRASYFVSGIVCGSGANFEFIDQNGHCNTWPSFILVSDTACP